VSPQANRTIHAIDKMGMANGATGMGGEGKTEGLDVKVNEWFTRLIDLVWDLSPEHRAIAPTCSRLCFGP